MSNVFFCPRFLPGRRPPFPHSSPAHTAGIIPVSSSRPILKNGHSGTTLTTRLVQFRWPVHAAWRVFKLCMTRSSTYPSSPLHQIHFQEIHEEGPCSLTAHGHATLSLSLSPPAPRLLLPSHTTLRHTSSSRSRRLWHYNGASRHFLPVRRRRSLQPLA